MARPVRRTGPVASAIVLGATVLVSCSGGTSGDAVTGGDPGAPATGATTRDAVPRAPTEPSAPVVLPVGTTTIVLTDDARGRVLPTHVHYPSADPAGGPDSPPALRTFPLVLMAHGYLLPPEGYARLLHAVAARGYVVAAPDFPHTTANGGDGNRDDLVNQPADLAAVATLMVAEAERASSVVPAIYRPDRIAVMGHSDGGLTAAAMAYNDAYRDERVAAAVVMTGGAGRYPGNWSVPGPPALLAVHGSADAVNPPSATDELVGLLPASVPRYVVSVDGGDHIAPYMGDTALEGISTVIADFLDVHLQQRSELWVLDRLRADAGVAPLTLTAE